MSETYDHRAIDAKWQDRWESEAAFATPIPAPDDEKAYILDFFPYPSGYGLHVGHLLGYTGSDVLARLARMRGKKVLHPMGWDSFGLPAENFAIKSGVHPAVSTARNILEFKRQFRQAGISYDWSKEITASDPEYYRWTQWLFQLLYRRGLAYRKNGLVNWCPGCQTVLANEQVVGGMCERCGSAVVQRELKQWYFKITDYADRLLQDLEGLDWPDKIKTMQRNWIGRSEGARLFFAISDRPEKIEVFTTRPDTVYGATYVVLAPEHPLVTSLTYQDQKEEVERYREAAAKKTELERTHLEKQKSGVFTGSYAVNPATGKPVPIWIADYVISSYGTGAIMAVPAHDERDYAFARKFELPIVRVVEGGELPWTGSGALTGSGEFSGHAYEEIADRLLTQIGGEKTVTYRLRDWLVSRQRFWGAPIPVAYDENGAEYLIPDNELPVKLPMEVEFLPTGQSPLSLAEEWKKYVRPEDGKVLVREVDTIDTFVCSSWYYLRFPTPHNDQAAFDAEAIRTWLPVDMYIGGAEHAVLHLLYARFITKVLYDAGLVPFQEPFSSLRNQGMILGPDHQKMSKSKGNVISPDDVVAQYGADAMRVYELFLAPFSQEKPWSTASITGVRRFLERIWKLREKLAEGEPSADENRTLHQLIRKVSDDIPQLRFNTAIAAMMEALNLFSDQESVSRRTYRTLLILLNPFAPHITEELWELLGEPPFLSLAPWPAYDPAFVAVTEVEYPVQINGKVRARVTVAANAADADVLEAARADQKVSEYLTGAEVVKEIVVPGRLVSFVVRRPAS